MGINSYIDPSGQLQQVPGSPIIREKPAPGPPTPNTPAGTNWGSPRHVAMLIVGTPKDLRGNFLLKIADELEIQKQTYLSGLFRNAGMEYNKKIGK